ncbi:NACHT domain-containing protein [Leptolyngbyaceae cyanobacterium CCMR0082]|uniref:NACHT domain-containing protein n=1 Tax=Adonisia turfae CCMR0082 TaxID=2304604 RepID=A0A6M0S8P9_9CYAN|nr:GUN4 domain-containing protein [Adonisia turfae]NEZ64182.1 NACHT domain-containing protein [Adonisia turfae CCMR0082]
MAADQPPGPERRWIEQGLNQFIRWAPLGGSGSAFLHFLLQQDWGMSIAMFPVTAVTGIWAAYTESFLGRLREIFSERGSQDAEALVNKLDRMDQALQWQLSGFDGKYLERVSAACLYSETEGYRQPDDIKIPLLAEVFVPLKFSGSGFSKNTAGDVVPFQMGTQSEEIQALMGKQGEQDPLTIWDILSEAKQNPRYRSIAIQAWGGFGKTTLMKHLAFTYAHNPGKVRRSKAPRLIPALLFLRKWKQVLTQENPPTLPELLENHYIANLPRADQLTIPTNWAKNALGNGKLLVMFDGFDEVAEADRPAISEWISEQIRNYSKSVFILTSRPGGYKQFTAEKPKTNLLVNPFNEDQREDFVRKWYGCQERYGRSQSKENALAVIDIANKKAEDLLQQIEGRDELQAMATNPLLLNMIATFHRFYPGSELPRKRAELYQEICRLQLGDRPRARQIDMVLSPEQAQQVLQSLALEMTRREVEIIAYDQLLALVTDYVTDLDGTVPVGELIKKVIRVSELLVEREPREYQFAHKSLQEYLTAAEIKRQTLEHLLIEKNEAWRGTVLLYAAQVTPTTRLIEGLCDVGGEEALTLAYDCWYENPRRVPETTYQRVMELSYGVLEEYMAKREWRKADTYTYQVMVQVCKQEAYLSLNNLRNFPCEDLNRIDDLWLKYSDNQLGFSVQKEIWVDVGGKLDFGKDWQSAGKAFQKFRDTVGWRGEDEWVYRNGIDFDSPEKKPGSLPCRGLLDVWVVGYDWWTGPVSSLASRLAKCNR